MQAELDAQAEDRVDFLRGGCAAVCTAFLHPRRCGPLYSISTCLGGSSIQDFFKWADEALGPAMPLVPEVFFEPSSGPRPSSAPLVPEMLREAEDRVDEAEDDVDEVGTVVGDSDQELPMEEDAVKEEVNQEEVEQEQEEVEQEVEQEEDASHWQGVSSWQEASAYLDHILF